MIAPINPQDHRIGSRDVRAWCLDSEHGALWEAEALAEAIHQTFERDAAFAEAVADHEASVAAYKADPRAEQTGDAGRYKSGPEGEDYIERPSDRYYGTPLPDPGTEIDRLGRLIVQAEYRRRAEEQSGGERG